MRLLVDVQCTQSSSSLRGIGRYALSFVRALVATRGEHQVELLLNGGDDRSRLLRARGALESFVPARRVHVFDAPWPWMAPYDERRRPAAEAAYAAAVRSIAPDVLLVCSVFEDDDETVLSLRGSADDPPTVAVLHDLMPALDPGTYLLGPSAPRYWRRLDQLRRCDALLSNSRYSAEQAARVFDADGPPVIPVWGGPYPSGDFPAFEVQQDDAPLLQVPPSFVLSVGGDHPRKNLDRLIVAWSLVRAEVRARGPLVLACRLNPGTVKRLRRVARRQGLGVADVVLTGGVSEATLQMLYRKASAFVFPSLEEGLGMPPLEAMANGCPTILARGSSLSELADDKQVYVDPLNPADIAATLERVLIDHRFREQVLDVGARSAARFTWQSAAERAWRALEQLPSQATGRRGVLPKLRPVSLKDSAAVEALPSAPAPVILDAPMPQSETGRLGLPIAPRALLAPATALVTGDVRMAADAVRNGLLEMPVLLDESQLRDAQLHDFYEQLRRSCDSLPLEEDLVRETLTAVILPPRWMLERPRPSWLLVSSGTAIPELPVLADAIGVDLLVTRLEAVALANLVDVVLVPAIHVDELTPALAAARCRGTRVVAVHGEAEMPTPEWCEAVALHGALAEASSWASHIAEWASRWDRSTGWPWRAG